MTIRPMTKPEMMYSYTQSQQIRSQTGNIGYLRADMDTNGKGFFSTWNGFRDDLKVEAFKDEFDAVINGLRFGEGPEFFLKDRTSLAKYCFSHPEAAINDREFGVRVDTQNYAYMMRLNPNRGEYNLYCYCYRKDWLDHHLKEAERGIRFIDSSYNDLFRIPDGGKIRITYPDGDRREETCRYVIWMIEKTDGTQIGDFCFKGLREDGIAEIGYGILEAYQGQGYATEAVQAACRWAFLHPDVRSLEAETDAENAASQRVLQKCGFRPNGTFGEEGPRFTLGRLDAAEETR